MSRVPVRKTWPEAKGNIHIDAWRTVTNVNGYSIEVNETGTAKNGEALFFINLGGYKENEFDEFHYKLLLVADNLENAKAQAKKTAFYKHVTLEKSSSHPNATSHIDDKYGVDVDDAHRVDDILPVSYKEKFRLHISLQEQVLPEDELHLGYFRLTDL